MATAAEHRYADRIREKMLHSGDVRIAEAALHLSTEQIIKLRDLIRNEPS